MKLQYLYLTFLLSFIKCLFAQNIQFGTKEDGNIQKGEGRNTYIMQNGPITITYKCNSAVAVAGTLYILFYCKDCSSPKTDQNTHTSWTKDSKYLIDCRSLGNMGEITLQETADIQAPEGTLMYLVYFVDFGEGGNTSVQGDDYYYKRMGTEKSVTKRRNVNSFSKNFENKKEKKEPWITKIRNYFIFAVPAIVLLVLLFVIYQKSFKPKKQLSAKKSICKYNFEKNPNTLKSLDSQGSRMTIGRNRNTNQKRNSLTNLKTLQSKLKSPITESVNYESSKPITSRRSSVSSSCSSNLSFKLDASYLDVKLKDDSDNEDNNNIESDDEEKLVNENSVALTIDDNRNRRRSIDSRNKHNYERKMSGNDNSPHHPGSTRQNSNDNRGDSRMPMNGPPAVPRRRDSTPPNARRNNSNNSPAGSPISPRRIDSNSNSPMGSPNSPNRYNMGNQYIPNNPANRNQGRNPSINNQVSIDIQSPKSTNPQNNVKLTSNLQDTLSTDKNAVIQNASKSYVTANSAPQVGNAQQTKVQYSNKAPQVGHTPQTKAQYSNNAPQNNKTNFQVDSTASGSEDTAEVVPNHPFTDKVFSVAYINIPENDDELELVIGDQVKFIEVYDDDWALALRIRDRKEGMVPLTCVKEYFTVLNKN